MWNNGTWILVIFFIVFSIVHSKPFAIIKGEQIYVQNASNVEDYTLFKMKGSNYYARDAMWGDFWTKWPWQEIQKETKMLKEMNINIVRLMIPYSVADWGGSHISSKRLEQLESLVDWLGELGIKSLLTLFNWETTFPSQGSSKERDHFQYLEGISSRFLNNSNVLMWDIKNEPDHPDNIGGFNNWNQNPSKRDQIVSWLRRMIQFLREKDPNHLITIGIRWWQNEEPILDMVDVASFHSYWPNIDQEIQDIRTFMQQTKTSPIIMEEFGWPSNPESSQYNEQKQLQFYQQQLQSVLAHNLTGYIQWMAFDAIPYTQNTKVSFENFFGLWRYDYSLKPAGAYYKSL